MIDTDKYEGHTPGPWKINGYFSSWKIYWFDKELSDNWDSIRDFGEEYLHENFCHDVGVVASSEANVKLMADAPLLLEEVKRLREDNELYLACINASLHKHKDGSALRRLRDIRCDQGRLREHEGALRLTHGYFPKGVEKND